MKRTGIWDLQREHPVGGIVKGVGVMFDEFNGVIPNLIVLTHEREKLILRDGRLMGAPEIVAEVLSAWRGQ